MDASRALIAIRRSSRDGVASAFVGIRPRVATANPPRASTSSVTTIPMMKLRIFLLIRYSLIRFQPARFSHDITDLGQKIFFLRRRERHRGILRRDADYGTVQVVEYLFVNDRRDLASDAAGTHVFMQYDDFVCLT